MYFITLVYFLKSIWFNNSTDYFNDKILLKIKSFDNQTIYFLLSDSM
jgi:hypothetical protein